MGTRTIIVSLLGILIFGMANKVHGQYIRSCATPSPLAPEAGPPPTGAATAALGAEAVALATPGGESLQLIPSICVSERYDSNVFFAPKTPGLQREDFVTNVSPKMHVNHNGEYAAGFLDLVGFYESYVRNPGLNYFGGSGSLFLNLDNSIKQVLPRAGLRVVDSGSYSPLPPGFSAPAAGTDPNDISNIQNAFARGILAFRTNNFTNTGTVSSTYATTASTNLEASYTHAMIRWGSSPGTAGIGLGGGFFDTTTQTGTVVGSVLLTGLDTGRVRYSHAQSDYVSSTTAPSFQTDTAQIGWLRTISENLRADLGGGVIVIKPGFTSWVANASLTMRYPNNLATIAYSRTVFPSILGSPTPLVGNAFTFSSIQTLSQRWQVGEIVSYTQSAGDLGPSKLEFKSYLAAVDVYYWISRIWSTAFSYDYIKVDQDSGVTKTDFDRQTITFNLRATWG